MQYRKDRIGRDISVLGYGCMRFSQKRGRIDLSKAEQEIMAAYGAGVNYFDTAYIYPGSEAALGEILEKNGIRENVHIATKLPQYLVKKREDPEKYFSEELRRLRTDYVDFYLMHMLPDAETWERLLSLGMGEWLQGKKEDGSISQVGFSYHGNSDIFCRLLDAYDWDFCQFQYNYLDENSQAGRTGLNYAAKKGIPVIIMEPLRGGKLVSNLPEKAKKLFQDHPSGWSPAEWAFRWLWDQPEVTCVLSGMNSLAMVEENVRVASAAETGAFSRQEQSFLKEVVEAINEKLKVGCTGCRYCMPCPQGVDIPGTFAAYNRRYTDGKFAAMWEYMMCTVLHKKSAAASNCVECGKCEKHCPQHIAIRQELRNARKALEGPVYHVASRVARLFMGY